MTRIALFGGTFDPLHRGHLAVARAAADRFSLDHVLFAPAGRQPLKPEEKTAEFADRIAMVELACGADARFRVSTLDAPRPDGAPNYTVDTLARLATAQPEARLFCLAGADSFQGLGRWREPERLLDLAEWIVVSRPGYRLGDPEGFPLNEKQRGRVHLLDTVHENVSATWLRAQLRGRNDCVEVLPSAVAKYIEAHGLYRGRAPSPKTRYHSR